MCWMRGRGNPGQVDTERQTILFFFLHCVYMQQISLHISPLGLLPIFWQWSSVVLQLHRCLYHLKMYYYSLQSMKV